MSSLKRSQRFPQGAVVRIAVAALLFWLAAGLAPAAEKGAPARLFRAGAYAMDITPDWFPVVVNGNFQPRYAKKAYDPLHARCLVMDDGRQQLAMVQVDSCALPQPMVDEIKGLIKKATGIPTGRVLMAATHTHSAPSLVGALNTPPDEKYCKFLPGRVAEGVRRAQQNLAPARVGWGVEPLPGLAQARRWIARPDKIRKDPFGEHTVRATMHPGFRNPDFEEPACPMDDNVSVLALQSPEGAPIALLAAYSIHYFGAQALSADYFGVFANRIAELVGAGDRQPAFVGILANGTSGSAYIRDYRRKAAKKYAIDQVADAVAQVAFRQYKSMEFHDWVPLAASEERLTLKVRKPKLAWAKKVLAEVKGKPLTTSTQVYAREQVLLAQTPPVRELKIQALRIGRLGIVGLPCEVYALTGLKLRRRSPLEPTFTISLANGCFGYLPPPGHMSMGGYTTWLARSSCLEAQAEPKIVASAMRALDAVAGDARVQRKPSPLPAYAAAVLASKPLAYWRLDEMNGPHPRNAATGGDLGTFETQIAYYMDGPRPECFAGLEADNRAPHFVGQRMKATLDGLGRTYTVEMWFYNAMPVDARAVTGYLFSRGPAEAGAAAGDHLAIGGTESGPGKLCFHSGADLKQRLTGTTDVPQRDWDARTSWHYVALVRDGKRVAVYLDGNVNAEIRGEAEIGVPARSGEIFLGGRNDGFANFEGKIDEVAVYDRALSAAEIARHYKVAAGGSSPGM